MKREKFLQTYVEFDNLLVDLGFETNVELNNHLTYLYKHYSTMIEPMHGIESISHKLFNVRLYLIRDRQEHKIMFTGGLGTFSEVMPLSEAKNNIVQIVKKEKTELLKKIKEIIINE